MGTYARGLLSHRNRIVGTYFASGGALFLIRVRLWLALLTGRGCIDIAVKALGASCAYAHRFCCCLGIIIIFAWRAGHAFFFYAQDVASYARASSRTAHCCLAVVWTLRAG